MRGPWWMAALSLSLCACGGLSREEFEDQYPEAICGSYMACDGMVLTFDSVEECTTFIGLFIALAPDEEDGCIYSEKDGEACLAAAESATCEDFTADGSLSACESVYTGECDTEFDTGG